MTPIKRVGFIGIGNMGWPMARNLVRAGFELVLADKDPQRLATFIAAHGGTAANSLTDLGREVDAAITMLPSGADVREVVAPPSGQGVADGLPPGAVVIDMSTSDPMGTQSLGAELEARGLALIDAPVAGGVVFAEDATLMIMVGGPRGAVERCRPLFDAMGGEIIVCGGRGTAHAMKALNNYVNAATLIAGIEALVSGRKFGIDLATMTKALISAATGRNNPIEKKIARQIIPRTFGSGMAIRLIAKDVRIAVDTARAIGAAAPLAETVAALWSQAAGEIGGDRDQTEIVRFWEKRAGITLTE
jgi:3-hydroxyisobutyrate dehydrogenase